MPGLGKIEVQLDKDYKYPKQKLQFNKHEFESYESQEIERQKKLNLDIIVSCGSREDYSQSIRDRSSQQREAVQSIAPFSSGNSKQ